MIQPDAVPSDELGEWLTWAPSAKPLFKWAGGKQRFLWDHRSRFAGLSGTYHEPFGGGLSVFFHLAATSPVPLPAVVADINLRVVRTFEEVRWEPEGVSDRLRQLEAGYNAAEDKAAFFNDVRESHNRRYPSHDGARFIFLMAAGFNGVFRINQSGHFNVPHGGAKGRLNLPSFEDVKSASVALSATKLRAQSWESGVTAMSPGDFAFFDPPYFHSENRRDLYEKNRLFTYSDHVRLADTLVSLRDRGVDFVLTNSAFEEMVQLYRQRGLQVDVIEAHRSINSKVSERGRVGELIVTPGSGEPNSMLRSAQLKLMLGDA